MRVRRKGTICDYRTVGGGDFPCLNYDFRTVSHRPKVVVFMEDTRLPDDMTVDKHPDLDDDTVFPEGDPYPING